jgi:cytochrome c oxidase assembly factor CtaG
MMPVNFQLIQAGKVAAKCILWLKRPPIRIVQKQYQRRTTILMQKMMMKNPVVGNRLQLRVQCSMDTYHTKICQWARETSSKTVLAANIAVSSSHLSIRWTIISEKMYAQREFRLITTSITATSARKYSAAPLDSKFIRNDFVINGLEIINEKLLKTQ